MAQETYSNPPSSLVAGDAYLWQDIPEDIALVSAYVVYFRSVDDSDVSFSVTGSDQTTYFEFTLSGVTTENLNAGDYVTTKAITYSWGRETSAAGKLVLSANPLGNPAKKFNQRIVELLESHLEGRLPEGLESHTIGGVPISKIPLSEADLLLQKYKALAKREQREQFAKDNPNQATGNTVHVHF